MVGFDADRAKEVGMELNSSVSLEAFSNHPSEGDTSKVVSGVVGYRTAANVCGFR